MERVRITLHEVMGRHRIKQSELAEASGVRYATLNPIYHGKAARLDLHTLARLVRGLRRLTGHPYSVADVLEYTETEGQDVDPQRLLDAGAVDLSGQLGALEADTPAAELDAWNAAFSRPA